MRTIERTQLRNYIAWLYGQSSLLATTCQHIWACKPRTKIITYVHMLHDAIRLYTQHQTTEIHNHPEWEWGQVYIYIYNRKSQQMHIQHKKSEIRDICVQKYTRKKTAKYAKKRNMHQKSSLTIKMFKWHIGEDFNSLHLQSKFSTAWTRNRLTNINWWGSQPGFLRI